MGDMPRCEDRLHDCSRSRVRRPYLDAAREVARWLIGSAIQTRDGPAWLAVRGDPGSQSAILYGAGAGAALFLTDLAASTGDAATAAAAAAAARFVARSADAGQFGLYTGYAGMVLAVDHAAAGAGQSGVGAALLRAHRVGGLGRALAAQLAVSGMS